MDISLDYTPFDLDFHPSTSIVATGLINGHLHLYRYSEDSLIQRLFEIRAHRKPESCRAVRFANSGSAILTASSDRSIRATDVETGKKIARIVKAHRYKVNRLVNLTETIIASGDDKGYIKWGWDTFRSSLRKNKVQSRSEFAEDALMSVVTMKNGRKVVCGTESGALLLYSWGHFEDCSDRFLGHSKSVDALLKLDEDTVISGSGDGLIRLVGILPNRIIQPLAWHSIFPIEGLAFSHDRKYLGSISHDEMLKLWDLQDLLDGKQDASRSQMVETDSDDNEMDMDVEPGKPSKGKRMRTEKSQNTTSATDFFADMDDS